MFFYGNSCVLVIRYGQVKFMIWRDKNGIFYFVYCNSNDFLWIFFNEVFELLEEYIFLGFSEDSKLFYLFGRYLDDGIFIFYLLSLEFGEYIRIFVDYKMDIEKIILDCNGMFVVGIIYLDKLVYEYVRVDIIIKVIYK